jgi:putative membrane protein
LRRPLVLARLDPVPGEGGRMTYDLLRGLHIIAMVAWMAGLLILPRLFVYHMRTQPGSDMETLFISAERRLMRLIMDPAMTATWLLGLGLITYNGVYRAGWDFLATPWMAVKLIGVAFVTGWHIYLAGATRRFAERSDTHSERWWRMTNELPFVAAIVMILAVTTEFGG